MNSSWIRSSSGGGQVSYELTFHRQSFLTGLLYLYGVSLMSLHLKVPGNQVIKSGIDGGLTLSLIRQISQKASSHPCLSANKMVSSSEAHITFFC